jgi:diadenosine tetraphosphate (Ap4A) HIT family hydrolase
MVNGEENCRKVYENEHALCIIDIGQVISYEGRFVPGRCLAIPKRHVARFHELEDEEAAQLFIGAKVVADKIKKAFGPDFVTVFIRGQQIAHTHIIMQPSVADDPVDHMFRDIREHFKIAPDDLLDDMAQRIIGV